MTNILGLITARGGSKELPRKNVLDLCGKPVIGWSIESALACNQLDRLIVTTEDEEISALSVEYGAEVPFRRPSSLATDDASHLSVVLHALDWLSKNEAYNPSHVVLLQPTSPLRSAKDIQAAIYLSQKEKAESVVSVCQSHHHPSLMYRKEGNVLFPFFSDVAKPGDSKVRRQAQDTAYFVNGAIYLTEVDHLRDKQTFMSEGSLALEMDVDRSLQIDSMLDFRVIEAIMEENLANESG